MPSSNVDAWSVPRGNRIYSRILTVSYNRQAISPAFETALKLATAFDAELHLLVVNAPPALPDRIAEADREASLAERRYAFLSASAAQQASNAQIPFQAGFATGRPVGQVLRYVIDRRIDLLVLGHIRGSVIADLLLGPLVVRLSRQAPCAVLLL